MNGDTFGLKRGGAVCRALAYAHDVLDALSLPEIDETLDVAVTRGA